MPTEDENDYDERYFLGQARINYELVRVDKKLIEALNTLIKILQADRSAHGLKAVDVSQLDAVLTEASKISGDVASIDPPGCQGPPPY
jgi:hypothetical protein